MVEATLSASTVFGENLSDSAGDEGDAADRPSLLSANYRPPFTVIEFRQVQQWTMTLARMEV